MRISHNSKAVLFLLSAFMQINATDTKTPKVEKEYDFMCGCKHIFYKNQFEPSENHFAGSSQSTIIAYNGQSDKIETNRASFSELIIPDQIVECFMAGRYSRLTGYFFTEPKKYFKITAEYQLDGYNEWKSMELKNFSGAPFWRKFDYYFDFKDQPTLKKVKIKVQSPIDVAENIADDIIYPLYMDEFKICKYCDGMTSNPLPALKKLEANTGKLVLLSENNYSISVPIGTNNVKIKPFLDPGFTGCTINVNGSVVSSGSFSPDIYLNSDPDKTTFIYVEVSKSLCESNIYVIEVKKPEGPDATLFNLKTSEGSISPSFYRFQNNYTILIPKEISTLKLTPFANDPKATIKVDTNKVETGTETGSINVSNNRTITIEVTARDGVTKRTYTVTILHEGPRISFVTTSSSGIESNANPVISVSITPAPDSGQTMTVQITATGGIAEDSVDFIFSPVTLTFTKTNLIQSFQLNIIDDSIGEPEETLLLTLVNTTGGAIIGKNRTHEYTIIDNETAIWVRSDIDTPGNGATWNTAFKYLRDAINAANLNSSIKTIRIAKGYYYPDQFHDSGNNFVDSDDICSSFELRDNLSLVGGYITENKREHEALANQTYLDGNISSVMGVVTAHIVTCTTSGVQPCLYSLTMQNGKSSISCQPEGGSAIYSNADKITLVDCCVQKNISGGTEAGAVYIAKGLLVASNCIFKSNQAIYAGAIWTNGRLILKKCQFFNNSVANSGGAVAIDNDSGALHKINECRFYNNNVNNGGSAIFYNGTGNLEIYNSIFNDNKAGEGGAIYVNNTGILKIANNSVFKNNNASVSGAGVFIGNRPLNFIVENSIFENNTQSRGGAISINNDASNITQTTFTNNFCYDPSGGAAINYAICDTNHIISGCIFINNKPKNTNCP